MCEGKENIDFKKQISDSKKHLNLRKVLNHFSKETLKYIVAKLTISSLPLSHLGKKRVTFKSNAKVNRKNEL